MSLINRDEKDPILTNPTLCFKEMKFVSQAGNQILDVNRKSFLNISHKQAVKVLKSTKNMIVTLKDIGRLPFTRVTHDKTKWITRSAKNGQIERWVICFVYCVYLSFTPLRGCDTQGCYWQLVILAVNYSEDVHGFSGFENSHE